MADLAVVKDFSDFYETNKEFVDKMFTEASGGKTLDIDTDLYQLAIEEGSVSVYEIYSEGSFIGYTSLVMAPDFLHKGEVTATVDHFALKEGYRGKGVATHVLTKVEEFLADSGVDTLYLCFPPTDKHDDIASKLGYYKNTVLHSKELGEK